MSVARLLHCSTWPRDRQAKARRGHRMHHEIALNYQPGALSRTTLKCSRYAVVVLQQGHLAKLAVPPTEQL